MGEVKEGLDLLREPFPESQISKLPKPTKRQTEEVRNDFRKGSRCAVCGQWHHPDVVHLDYVGHAALTNRLLDCDPVWNWEPMALTDDGLPARDSNGGMWIKLTVCGHTRIGYGDAPGKQGGDAVKEVIGDALRNAAMRFGAALDLWHKGDLHADTGDPGSEDSHQTERGTVSPQQYIQLRDKAYEAGVDEKVICGAFKAPSLDQMPADLFEPAMRKLEVTLESKADERKSSTADLDPDEIPY